jgi:3alpha(or 20beta)-hydroxysteroid dehydrogenase
MGARGRNGAMLGPVERLQGKIALVTGAARGSGAAIARLFVAEGARVVVTDVLDESGTAAAAELGSAARYLHLDVTSEDDWDAAVESVQTHEARLDVVVHNAAVLHLATIDATSTEAFERLLRVNVVGAFLGTRACLPLLRASGSGSIVHIGSIDSVRGTSLTSAYTASKWALRGLTKVIALENRTRGVRANIVCPALGNPEMLPPVVGAGPAPARELIGRTEPDLTPVAEAACWFASDASKLCTGVELVLDEGESAGLFLDLPDAWFDPRLREAHP